MSLLGIKKINSEIEPLKDKIRHSKDNILEGFCETGTVDEKITCFIFSKITFKNDFICRSRQPNT